MVRDQVLHCILHVFCIGNENEKLSTLLVFSIQYYYFVILNIIT